MEVPIPGEDAQWAAICPNCDMTIFVSRGGFKNGGIEHCYECGLEKETKGITENGMKRMIMSSKHHWEKYQLLPYDWHTLTEEMKWTLLGFRS